jgi:hypothetical protein
VREQFVRDARGREQRLDRVSHTGTSADDVIRFAGDTLCVAGLASCTEDLSLPYNRDLVTGFTANS